MHSLSIDKFQINLLEFDLFIMTIFHSILSEACKPAKFGNHCHMNFVKF